MYVYVCVDVVIYNLQVLDGNKREIFKGPVWVGAVMNVVFSKVWHFVLLKTSNKETNCCA